MSSSSADNAGSAVNGAGSKGSSSEPSPAEGVISRAGYDLFRTRDDLPKVRGARQCDDGLPRNIVSSA